MGKYNSERRKYQRSYPNFLTKVTVSPLEKDEEYCCIINDISHKGLGLAAFVDLHPETLVDIKVYSEYQEEWTRIERYSGKIGWCKPDPFVKDSFNIGIVDLRGID